MDESKRWRNQEQQVLVIIEKFHFPIRVLQGPAVYFLSSGVRVLRSSGCDPLHDAKEEDWRL